MKTTTPEMAEHIAKGVTALATCWEIKRRDGKEFLFTDCDQDIVVEGKKYLSIGAYARSAIESTSSLSVDNLDVAGITSDLAMPAHELQAGLFDHAQVFIFVTPWMEAYPGKLKLRRGFFGEVSVMPNGTYNVELRGLMQRFGHTLGEVYSATCRHDFGDRKCGVPVMGHLIDARDYGFNETAVAHSSNRIPGKKVTLNLGDPDFSDLGAYGIENARYWYDRERSGANDFFTEEFKHSDKGTHRVSGTGGVLAQDFPLVDGETITEDAIDAGNIHMTINTLQRDGGVGSGEIRVNFLDWQRRPIRHSSYFERLTPPLGNLTVTRMALNDFCVEAWFNFDNSISGGLVGNDENGNHQSIEFIDSGVRLRSEKDKDFKYHPWEGRDTTVVDVQDIFGPEPDVFGKEKLWGWNHVAVSRIGDTISLYVNGKLVDEQTGWTTPFNIDRLFQDHENHMFYGKIDEFRIWNIGRTGAEIRTYMKEDLAVETYPDLLWYLPCLPQVETQNHGTQGGSVLMNFDIADLSPVTYVHRGPKHEIASGIKTEGENWGLIGMWNLPVPHNARMARLAFEGDGPETCFAHPHGWLLNDEYPQVATPEAFSPCILQCTRAGVVTYPEGQETLNIGDPAPGTVLEIGSAEFTVRERIFRTARVVETFGNRTFRIQLDDHDPDADADGWYDGGLCTFYSGKNAGASMEVKSWKGDTDTVELFLSMTHPVEVGDTVSLYPGCDKTRICCSALFDNIKNFFGTPDIPGEDFLFSYPDAK